jgi:hypothetical protein
MASHRVLAALFLCAAPAAAFQPGAAALQPARQHRYSVALSSTIDNRRAQRSRSNNEASEGFGIVNNEASQGFGIVNVPLTEDAIKAAKVQQEGRTVASSAAVSVAAIAAAASDAVPDLGFDPWSPFS